MWAYQKSRLKMTPRPIPCTHSYIVIESANKELPTVISFGAMFSARCFGDGGGALFLSVFREARATWLPIMGLENV